jgi:two-component system response regulator AtoC
MLPNLPPEEVIFGSSEVMGEIRRNIKRAALAEMPVLFQGETGTGKEVLARFLHHCCCRTGSLFVKVNCPTIPVALFESELFGYKKGAFSGAYESKLGQVELARGGTLFLDQIGDLDLNAQAKLLQLLQDGQYHRLGSQRDEHIEALVVCATNKPLAQAVKYGTFREDLYYRISGLSLDVPSLRQRASDIPMLIGYFLEKYGRKYGRAVRPISSSLLDRLQKYQWPGNIRQLENMLHSYAVFESEQVIASKLEDRDDDLVSVGVAADTSVGLKKITQQAAGQLERRVILETLEANAWHRRLAARSLGISYRALLYKMRKAGFPLKRSRLCAAEHPGVKANLDGVASTYRMHHE